MDKQNKAFLQTALLIPTVQASIGTNWLPTLIVGIAAVLCNVWAAYLEKPESKAYERIRIIIIMMLTARMLHETPDCWQGRGNDYFIPLAVLVLSSYTAWQGKEGAANAVGILRFGIIGVLFALLYAGIGNIEWKELKPYPQWPRSILLAILLLPNIEKKQIENGKIMFSVMAVLTGAVTAGTAGVSIYEYSRGIAIKGIAEHLESITACAVTLGYYGVCTWLLTQIREALGKERWKYGIVVGITGIMSAAVPIIRDCVYAILIGIMWLIVPSIETVKKKMKKNEKCA